MNLKNLRLPTSAKLRPRNAKNHPVSIFKDPKGLPIMSISKNIIQPINFDRILSKQNNNFEAQLFSSKFEKNWTRIYVLIEFATKVTKK